MHVCLHVCVCACMCAHGNQRRTLSVLSYHFLHYSLEIRSPVGLEARMEVSKSWWSAGLYPWELWSCWQVWQKPAFYRSARNQLRVLLLAQHMVLPTETPPQNQLWNCFPKLCHGPDLTFAPWQWLFGSESEHRAAGGCSEHGGTLATFLPSIH